MRVSAHEARRDLAKLMRAVGRGEVVVVERHGHPVAGIVPAGIAEAMLRSGALVSMSRIEKALERASRIKGVQSLVLFGSYARGDANPRSDVDVVIVLDDNLADPLAVHVSVEQSVMGSRIPFEFLLVTASEWRMTKTGIVAVARREGREIHGRS